MVSETLRNSIPKAVVNCQVREAKRSLLDRFYARVGSKEVCTSFCYFLLLFSYVFKFDAINKYFCNGVFFLFFRKKNWVPCWMRIQVWWRRGRTSPSVWSCTNLLEMRLIRSHGNECIGYKSHKTIESQRHQIVYSFLELSMEDVMMENVMMVFYWSSPFIHVKSVTIVNYLLLLQLFI